MNNPSAVPSNRSARVQDANAADGAGRSPLGVSLGLEGGEVALLGRLFRELTASMGIDGAPVFDRLRRGQSIGQALAVPDDVVERVYARAHRWFALGQVDRAATLFRALCLLREEDADFWLGYGVCMRLADEPEKAARAFESAANLRPDWALPWCHALELALHGRQWSLARTALSAYDARVGDGVPAGIAAEVARLRLALAHGLAEDPAGSAPSSPALSVSS